MPIIGTNTSDAAVSEAMTDAQRVSIKDLLTFRTADSFTASIPSLVVSSPALVLCVEGSKVVVGAVGARFVGACGGARGSARSIGARSEGNIAAG